MSDYVAIFKSNKGDFGIGFLVGLGNPTYSRYKPYGRFPNLPIHNRSFVRWVTSAWGGLHYVVMCIVLIKLS